MSTPWIEHVQAYRARYGGSWKEALVAASPSYRSSYRSSSAKAANPEKMFEAALMRSMSTYRGISRQYRGKKTASQVKAAIIANLEEFKNDEDSKTWAGWFKSNTKKAVNAVKRLVKSRKVQAGAALVSFILAVFIYTHWPSAEVTQALRYGGEGMEFIGREKSSLQLFLAQLSKALADSKATVIGAPAMFRELLSNMDLKTAAGERWTSFTEFVKGYMPSMFTSSA